MATLTELVDTAVKSRQPDRRKLITFLVQLRNLHKYHKTRGNPIPINSLQRLLTHHGLTEVIPERKGLYNPRKYGDGRPRKIVNTGHKLSKKTNKQSGKRWD